MSTILVVEYDQQHRVWMRQVLESKGYQVEEAGDGYEALACIERGRLAMVVLDLSSAQSEWTRDPYIPAGSFSISEDPCHLCQSD